MMRLNNKNKSEMSHFGLAGAELDPSSAVKYVEGGGSSNDGLGEFRLCIFPSMGSFNI